MVAARSRVPAPLVAKVLRWNRSQAATQAALATVPDATGENPVPSPDVMALARIMVGRMGSDSTDLRIPYKNQISC